MPSNSLKIFVAIGVLVLPVVAAAHHSANEFDQSKVVEIDGLIVDVFWRNPYVIIKVAADMGDPDAVWELEGASVSSLSRRGLSRDLARYQIPAASQWQDRDQEKCVRATPG